MPDEPNNRMDEALRSYAEERRKAPEVPLHPATRKMFQEEVRRVHQKAAGGRENSRSWLARFWPQFALGAAVFVVLVIGLVSPQLTHSKGKKLMAAKAPESHALPTVLPVAKDEVTGPAANELPPVAQREIAPAPAAEPAKPQERSLAVRDKEVAQKVEEQARATPLSALSPTKEVLAQSPALPSEKRAEAGSTTSFGAAPMPVQPLRRSPEKSLPKAVADSTTDNFQKEQRKAEQKAKDSLAPGKKAQVLGEQEAMKAPAPAVNTPTVNLTAAAPAQTPALGLAAGAAVPTNPISTENLRLEAAKTDLAYRPAVSFDQSQQIQNLGAALRTYFVTTKADGGRADKKLPVLNSFQMEQLGEQVRFVDADGSTYDGLLTEETNSAVLRTIALQNSGNRFSESGERGAYRSRAFTPQQGAAPVAAWNFQTTGRNQTLGQEVVFKGNLIEPAADAKARADAQAVRQLQVRRQQGQNVRRATINGTATIATTNQMQIQAVAPPK
jgi:hypothetical protein